MSMCRASGDPCATRQWRGHGLDECRPRRIKLHDKLAALTVLIKHLGGSPTSGPSGSRTRRSTSSPTSSARRRVDDHDRTGEIIRRDIIRRDEDCRRSIRVRA
jgi:hypothetical protein